MDYENAKHKRKMRKLIMDQKRNRVMFDVSNTDTSCSSHLTRFTQHENKNHPTPVPCSNKLRIISYEKENTNIAYTYAGQSSTFLTPTSNSSFRIPLSEISNGNGNLNINIQTPVSENGNRIFSSMPMSSTNNSTVINNSSLAKLKKGRHILKNKKAVISPIPMVDLTMDEEVDTNLEIDSSFVGISKDYLDHGDQTFNCGVCKAKFWKEEARRCIKKRNSYSLCCNYGKVQLPDYTEPPKSYSDLFRNLDTTGAYFLKNIRRYNSMFSFTSMGGKIDKSVNRGNAPYVFRISGQNYHAMGSLLPANGSRPKFSQLYIYDTENEISNRQNCFRDENDESISNSASLDLQMIQFLKDLLDSNNGLVQWYRMARDCFHAYPDVDLKLRIIGKRERDMRTYNVPTASEVAALIVGDFDEAMNNRDIIVETKSGELQPVSELHPSYLPLQYPLLFPFGEDGYTVNILHRGANLTEKTKRQTCTMREFFAYRIQDRDSCFSLILNARRLFQQFLVDGYTMIESERLFYIRREQSNLRCDTFENLRKVQIQGNTNVSNVGQRVILPSSFTGGARYMMQNYLDAMSLCKWYGYPDYFITVTCNPKWPKIKRFLKDTALRAEDRPDILCRLFKMKLDSLIKDLKEKKLLGNVKAVVYTIEFQKRGLPHSHICLFMHPDDKLPTVEHIDPVISAEIPNIEDDPELYELVKEFMIHGPCGVHNMNCSCMVDNKCSKKFPKRFVNQTMIDNKGYAQYKRRNNGCTVKKNGVELDNGYVVPYNKILLKKYQSHINVEWCNQAGSIKYLFKYINKGPDKATVEVVQDNDDAANDVCLDEIKQFYDCRYLSACESSWRIFGYEVHYRYPSVIRLPFHLPGQQSVVYGAEDDIDCVLNKPSIASSMFLSWFECNKKHAKARTLAYVEMPTEFVFKKDNRSWEPRKIGFSIGRVHSVSPSAGEAYFLRILLNKVKGPTCFEDIRTVDGEIRPTFRDACYARGLLADDKEYIEAIKEACESGTEFFVRSLFAMMLLNNTLARPDYVWENTWEHLSDDILYMQQKKLKCPGLSLNEDQIRNLALFEIEKLLVQNNSSLKNFSVMPYPDDDSLDRLNNRHIMEELDYDKVLQKKELDDLFLKLTDEQRGIFETIMSSVKSNKGGVYFVYGYGGTGKTFLWRTLSASLRSVGDIVLNVASSGIASLLLPGGRTTHSRFGIPINLTEVSSCYVKPNSDQGSLLQKTKLIIWDEAPMTHKHAFESLDRCLNDVMGFGNCNRSDVLFGKKVIVFGGDFRQVLPVIPNGSRQDIVNASLCSSYIWQSCKILTLTKNMRLMSGSSVSDIEETRIFAQWLLDIGEGKVGGQNDGDAIIDIPADILITDSLDPIGSLIDFVYPSVIENSQIPHYFQDRAILAPTNEVVREINDRLLSMFPGEEKEYLSSDSLCEDEYLNGNFDTDLYSPDVLNGLKISGLPNHKLVLKVGVPVMLLRNIDQKNCLCNGTRLQVLKLGIRVIEAQIISGGNIGYRAFIPRLSLSPSDKKIPFRFQRRQFPIAVSFAMTINKSQGQSLSTVGLFLKQPVFSHGQLYVALSRVKSRKGLKILVLDQSDKLIKETANVVFKEIFSNL